jgi:hypothetical protein
MRISPITVYVREDDDDVWQWSRRHAQAEGISLARLIVIALRAYQDTINP